MKEGEMGSAAWKHNWSQICCLSRVQEQEQVLIFSCSALMFWLENLTKYLLLQTEQEYFNFQGSAPVRMWRSWDVTWWTEDRLLSVHLSAWRKTTSYPQPSSSAILPWFTSRCSLQLQPQAKFTPMLFFLQNSILRTWSVKLFHLNM